MHWITRYALTCILCITLPSLTAAPDGLRLTSKLRTELKGIPEYGEASKAMADHLPEVAATKFRGMLSATKLSDEAKSVIQLMLAEALVLSSIQARGDEKFSKDALKLLENKNLSSFPTFIIWRAEALASLGRYQEAEKALTAVPRTHSLHEEANLARARILIALDQTEHSLTILSDLVKSKKSNLRNTASLLTAELYINTGKIDLALKSLEQADTEVARTAKMKEYLAARLALIEGKTAEAINRFQSLVTAPEDLPSTRIFHASFLGLADAQEAHNDVNSAISTLEQFITDYPNSAVLQSAFDRLVAFLPEKLGDDHPSIQKFREWAGEKPVVSQSSILGTGNGIVSLEVTDTNPLENHDLAALALFYRAKLLTRVQTEQNLDQAITILTRLRGLYLQSSQSPSELYLELFSASLLETAYIRLQQKNPELATFSLSVMEKITFSPQLKNRASMLRGEILASKDEYEGAMLAFQTARLSSSEAITENASINAGIMALKSSSLQAFDKIIDSSDDAKIKASLTLERALWKCSKSDIQGRIDLESFIMANPKHPRENEARLALAAACVNTNPPDISQSKAQLEIISPRMTEANEQAQITRIRIRAESLLMNWLAAAKAAEKFLKNFEGADQSAVIQFKCGEAYYHNEDFNKARRIFQGFEKKYPENLLKPYAKFYEAMSARLGGTVQSREECITMFQGIIDSKHPLASEARIQQSRVLIDLQRYDEAQKTLKPLMASKSISSSEKLGAGVLMADCLQRQGISDQTMVKEAISIYNDLLKIKEITPAWSHRLHYLRGQAHESLKETTEAFESYYNVIIKGRAPDDPQSKQEEWFWFYRCGFKALAMLENTKRWEASVKTAKRIASFNGPRKEEAYNRAKELARTHMIWQEDEPQKNNTEKE
ncbi:MAG: tetratricopeptide repeat protein [Akkermansiaceae bacterium]